MKAAYTSAFALVAVLAAGPAAAEHVSFTSVDHMVKAEPGVNAKTRAQVMAELADAQKSMDVRPSDQFGRTVSEVSPGYVVPTSTAAAKGARAG